MRAKKSHFSLVLILIALSQVEAFATTEVSATSKSQKKETFFSANWPAERPPGESLPVFRSHNCGGGKRPPLHFAYWIQSYFEPNNLSEKAKAQLRLEIKTDNWKNWYKLWTTNCTPADLFYIEQAIWEASPFAYTDGPTSPGKCSLSYKTNGTEFLTTQQRRRETHGLCSNFSCKALYRKEHPEITSEIVVMHFIPLSAAQRFSTAIEQDELHNLKNLKAIELNRFNSTQLDAFRDEWTKFLKSPSNTMNRQMVLKEADRLAAKYHSLFLD